MSGQSAREVIARALNFEAPESLNYDMSRWLADDILDALADAGWSVVKLPERRDIGEVLWNTSHADERSEED